MIHSFIIKLTLLKLILKQERTQATTNNYSLSSQLVLLYFCFQTPDKIVHSAAHLLLSIVTTVRPQFFLQIECVQGLYHSAGQGLYRDLNMEVSQIVFGGIVLNIIFALS